MTGRRCEELHREYPARQAGFNRRWEERAKLVRDREKMEWKLADVEASLLRNPSVCLPSAPRYDRTNRRPKKRGEILRDSIETVADTAECALKNEIAKKDLKARRNSLKEDIRRINQHIDRLTTKIEEDRQRFRQDQEFADACTANGHIHDWIAPRT